MQFEPQIHTKEFLMENVWVALELAEYSSDFAMRELIEDHEILTLSDKEIFTVAHKLAQHQTIWLKSKAS
jgi:hypothetical protein